MEACPHSDFPERVEFIMKRPNISRNVIRRLPRYLRKLDELSAAGVERISSSEFGTKLGFTPSQIRQDLSCFGEFGQQGYGYNVARLRAEIAHILGADRSYSIILVGTGRIGQSLIENINFSRLGFRLLGAFDIRPELIGRQIGEITVQDAAMVHEFIRENGVDIAILSTNRDQAQSVAEGLIASGIHAIWNFTEMELDPGQSGVVVKGIHFSDSLLELSYFLSEAN